MLPCSLRRQLRGEGLRQEDRRAQIDGLMRVPVAHRDRCASSGSKREALLMRSVNGPSVPLAFLMSFLGVSRAGKIALDRHRLAAEPAHLIDEFCRFADRLVAMDGDVPAILGEVERHRPPDALRRTGDERCLHAIKPSA